MSTKNVDSNDNPSLNGIIIKEELIIDDVSCEEKQTYDDQEIVYPIITSVKSEYIEFTVKGEGVKYENHDNDNQSDSEGKKNFKDVVPRSSEVEIEFEANDQKPEFNRIQIGSSVINNRLNISDLTDRDQIENSISGNELLKIERVLDVREDAKVPRVIKNTSTPNGFKDFLSPEGFKCTMCLRVFRYFKPFQKHISSHNEPVNSDRKLENLRSKTNPIVNKFGTIHDQRKLIQARTKTDNVQLKKIQLNKPINKLIQGDPYIKALVENGKTHNKIIKKPIKKPFVCLCGALCKKKSSLAKCVRTHGGHVCRYCPELFTQKQDMTVHEQSVHLKLANKLLECTFCRKTFKYAKTYRSHLQKHEDLKRRDEEMERLEEETTRDSDEESTQGDEVIDLDETFKCEHCAEDFDDSTSLKRHVNANHKKPSPTQILRDKKALIFKFKCKICGLGHFTLKTLVQHELQHSKSPAIYKCTRCQDQFRHAYELSNHQKLYCRRGQSSATKNIKSIVKTVTITPKPTTITPKTATSPQKHLCDVCSMKFTSEIMMLRHKATHPFVTFAEDDSTQKQIFFK